MNDQLKPKPVMMKNSVNRTTPSSSNYYNPHRKTLLKALENHLPIDVCTGGRWFYGAEVLDYNEQEGWVEVKTIFSESDELDDKLVYTFSIGTLSLRSITALFVRDNQTLFNPSKSIIEVKETNNE